MDPAKLLFIAVAALIVLGPERLPTAARKLGELWSLVRSPATYLAEHLGEVLAEAGLPRDALGMVVGSAAHVADGVARLVGTPVASRLRSESGTLQSGRAGEAGQGAAPWRSRPAISPTQLVAGEWELN